MVDLEVVQELVEARLEFTAFVRVDIVRDVELLEGLLHRRGRGGGFLVFDCDHHKLLTEDIDAHEGVAVLRGSSEVRGVDLILLPRTEGYVGVVGATFLCLAELLLREEVPDVLVGDADVNGAGSLPGILDGAEARIDVILNLGDDLLLLHFIYLLFSFEDVHAFYEPLHGSHAAIQ